MVYLHQKSSFNVVYVRASYFISPSLFALSTQPLMSLLSRAAKAGQIKGLCIKPGTQLLHQLFANMGIFLESTKANFLKVTSLITLYVHIRCEVEFTQISAYSTKQWPLTGLVQSS